MISSKLASSIAITLAIASWHGETRGGMALAQIQAAAQQVYGEFTACGQVRGSFCGPWLAQWGTLSPAGPGSCQYSGVREELLVWALAVCFHG